jgi:hypothetical protein
MAHGALLNIYFSIFYIVSSAITTETGEPIGTPVFYLYKVLLYLNAVASRHTFTSYLILSLDSDVLSFTVGSSSRAYATHSLANGMGIDVNRLLTSNETS